VVFPIAVNSTAHVFTLLMKLKTNSLMQITSNYNPLFLSQKFRDFLSNSDDGQTDQPLRQQHNPVNEKSNKNKMIKITKQRRSVSANKLTGFFLLFIFTQPYSYKQYSIIINIRHRTERLQNKNNCMMLNQKEAQLSGFPLTLRAP